MVDAARAPQWSEESVVFPVRGIRGQIKAGVEGIGINVATVFTTIPPFLESILLFRPGGSGTAKAISLVLRYQSLTREGANLICREYGDPIALIGIVHPAVG